MDELRYCPRCGAERWPGSAFCGRCHLPFDHAGPPPPRWRHKPWYRRLEPVIIVVVIVVVVALIGVTYLPRGADTSTGADARYPPPGTIWFGDSFDTGTFEMQGRRGAFSAGQPVAFIAHLSRPFDGTGTIELGSASGRVGISTFTTTADKPLWGGTLAAFYFNDGGPAFTIRMLDVGNNELARGDLTVTP